MLDYPKTIKLDHDEWQRVVKSSRQQIVEAKNFSELSRIFIADRSTGGSASVLLDTVARALELLGDHGC